MTLKNAFADIALDETLQRIAIYLEQLSSSLGRTYPDSGGNLRTVISSGTVTTVTTVSTLSNIAAIGSTNAQYDQYEQIMIGANAIRNQIIVS